MRPPTPPPPDPGTGLSKPLPRERRDPAPPILRTLGYGVAVVLAVVVSLGGPGLAIAVLFGVDLVRGVAYWVGAIVIVWGVYGCGGLVELELAQRRRR